MDLIKKYTMLLQEGESIIEEVRVAVSDLKAKETNLINWHHRLKSFKEDMNTQALVARADWENQGHNS